MAKVHWKINNKIKRNQERFFKKSKWNLKILIKNKKEVKSQKTQMNNNLRVWSWLRINAGGAHKTCKSNGSRYKGGEDLSDSNL